MAKKKRKKRLRGNHDWDVPGGYPGQSTSLGRAFRKYKPYAMYGFIAYMIFWAGVNFLAMQAADFLNLGMMLGMQVLQIVMYFGFFFWYLAGRISVKVYYPGDIDLGWDDFVGLGSIKERAKMLVGDLSNPGLAKELGGIRTAHAVFCGSPGTGKTLLAKIVAAQAGVPVMVVSAGSLLGTFIGMGRLKVVQLFAKCFRLEHIWGGVIMVWDEIDSIGGARGGQQQGRNMFGGSPGTQVLNEILTQLSGIAEPSGFKHRLRTLLKATLGIPYKWTHPNFLVVAATNRPDILDPALLRSGRLEQRIDFPVPTRSQLAEVIDYYLNNWKYEGGAVGVPHDETCDPTTMAWIATGSTPADVERYINDTKRLAKKAGHTQITFNEWSTSVIEGKMGLRQPMPLSARDKKGLAYHEAGHAVMVKALEQWAGQAHPMPIATIVRYGPALGHIQFVQTIEHIRTEQHDLEYVLMIAVASLAAEQRMDARTPGTSADLQNVQFNIRLMISQGMIGDPFMIKRLKEAPGGAPEIALGELTERGEALAVAYYERRVADALQIIERNQDALDALANALIVRETLFYEDIQEVLGDLVVPCELGPFLRVNTRRC